ncbi:MAG: hypothetical protein HC906_17475, partial [Bacteroidales bacterium]|nr:hypothetical protein [Bacteroidales bacterium]
MDSLYRLTNQIIDSITGFSIASNLFNALEFDFKSRNEIENYQAHQFKILAEIAVGSEFYNNYQNKTLSDFPVITRDVFRKNSERLKTKVYNPYATVYSSGSTTNQVKHFITRQMLLAKRVSHQRMLTWYGLNRESPELKIGGLPSNKKTMAYHYLKNKRHFSSYDLTEDKLPGLVKIFQKFKPKVLTGYPSSIYHFLKYAHLNNIPLPAPGIVITHAENLYPDIVGFIKLIFLNPLS